MPDTPEEIFEHMLTQDTNLPLIEAALAVSQDLNIQWDWTHLGLLTNYDPNSTFAIRARVGGDVAHVIGIVKFDPSEMNYVVYGVLPARAESVETAGRAILQFLFQQATMRVERKEE